MLRITSALALLATVGLASSAASAQSLTKMTIATGVDPAFSQFYVAKEAGLFEKNGLDVTINTGPSGSAMVPFLINNQIHAAYGSDLAGVINHNVDNNIVVVADGTYLLKWLSVIGRNVPDMAALKGKRVAIAKGTGAEIFWNRVVEKLKLNASDYKIIDVESPEM
ncbi:MAG TPA: ABC transporter substrate-binding protein, partial [Pyrinomonadaceae bacterium]|nr:ABC transporter substrate-binding protein [Pyrinomonadaceae bacterium]